jgi:hypothetical protein
VWFAAGSPSNPDSDSSPLAAQSEKAVITRTADMERIVIHRVTVVISVTARVPAGDAKIFSYGISG